MHKLWHANDDANIVVSLKLLKKANIQCYIQIQQAYQLKSIIKVRSLRTDDVNRAPQFRVFTTFGCNAQTQCKLILCKLNTNALSSEQLNLVTYLVNAPTFLPIQPQLLTWMSQQDDNYM